MISDASLSTDKEDLQNDGCAIPSYPIDTSYQKDFDSSLHSATQMVREKTRVQNTVSSGRFRSEIVVSPYVT